ncbi:MAG: YjfB family protein [Eubacteriales bacterium]
MNISQLTQIANGAQDAIGLAVLKKAMDQDTQVADSFVNMMENSVTPYLGKNLDIRV